MDYGALFSPARVRALAETVNALEPDVLLLGGEGHAGLHGLLA